MEAKICSNFQPLNSKYVLSFLFTFFFLTAMAYNTVKSDPVELCKTSLSKTLKTASSTSALVKKIAKSGGLSSAEKGIVNDCVELSGDSVDQLKNSLNEMDRLKTGPYRSFQIDSIKTWVSAAITDGTTCTDELEEGKVRESLKNKIEESVKNLTGQIINSLALINRNLH